MMPMTEEQKKKKKTMDALKKAWLLDVFTKANPSYDAKDKDHRKKMNKAWAAFRAECGFPVNRPGRKLSVDEVRSRAADEVKKNARAFGKKTATGMKKALEAIRGSNGKGEK